MRLLTRFALAGLVFALAVSGALLAGVLLPRPVSGVSASGGAHEIVLVANPIHTDIALPASPQVLARLGFLGEAGLPLDHSGVGTILIGWGGREFYTQTPTWADLGARAVFASLTRDASVLHFGLAPPIEPGFPKTRRLVLSDAQFEALLHFVEESLTRGADGRPIVASPGYGPFDIFFEAKGIFNIVVGCNVWTSAALAASGLRTGWWTPLPQTLFRSLDWHRE
ncbi:TIGR02117 family protein [Aureimonas mangrovi]|uniref:TIGR02117 family protein n=1 Tax=Aureimonas mangrovi TaxID=2758041 RepID=UPI00163DB645|nr:TIGR02117 family protein [Aureimonas mangrovi]